VLRGGVAGVAELASDVSSDTSRSLSFPKRVSYVDGVIWMGPNDALNMDLAVQPGGGATYKCSAAALADMLEQRIAVAVDKAQLVCIPLSEEFPYPGGRVNGGRLFCSGTPSTPTGTAASGSNDDAAKLTCRVPCGPGGKACGAQVTRPMMRQHVAAHILRLECGPVCGAAASSEQVCGFCGVVGSCDSKLVAGSTKSTKAVGSDCASAGCGQRALSSSASSRPPTTCSSASTA
jgi:hypothetical protein